MFSALILWRWEVRPECREKREQTYVSQHPPPTQTSSHAVFLKCGQLYLSRWAECISWQKREQTYIGPFLPIPTNHILCSISPILSTVFVLQQNLYWQKSYLTSHKFCQHQPTHIVIGHNFWKTPFTYKSRPILSTRALNKGGGEPNICLWPVSADLHQCVPPSQVYHPHSFLARFWKIMIFPFSSASTFPFEHCWGPF